MKKLLIKYELKIKSTLFAFCALGHWYKNHKKEWKAMSPKEQIEFNDGKLQSYKLAYGIREVLRNPKKYEGLA